MSCAIDLRQLEIWFVTGSQHLYGPAALEKVAVNAREVADALGTAPAIPVKIVFRPVVTSAADATVLCQQANNDPKCAGLITWCHTFSPSKMWINGLRLLQKPLLHFHTQHNQDIPWDTIDMDFMNLNQAAHGDREHGFIMSRMRLRRKVVGGFWRDAAVQARIGSWTRAAAAWHDWQGATYCRFGDNMRDVAVTEGDKVSAQIQFGYAVNGFGVGDLVKRVEEVSDGEIDDLLKTYVRPDKPLPKLPVARAVWVCKPDLPTAAAAWIYAGGAHHTGFSPAVTTEMLEDFGEIAGLETVIIDAKTTVRKFRKELRCNEVYYSLANGFVS